MTTPHVTLRGFTAAVSREDVAQPGAAGIAIGMDGAGADRVVALALRHADGTMLTAYLSDDALGRLAMLLATHGVGVPIGPDGERVTLQ